MIIIEGGEEGEMGREKYNEKVTNKKPTAHKVVGLRGGLVHRICPTDRHSFVFTKVYI